jgi:hypothetical protein
MSDYLPSKKHGQFTATPLHEQEHDLKCPCIDIPGPGKFEGNDSLIVSKFLYNYTLDGFQDEQYGSVTEPSFIWEALIVIDWGMFPGEGYDPLMDILKPAYIVWEDSHGFFSYVGYDTEEEARNQYMINLAAYESYYS